MEEWSFFEVVGVPHLIIVLFDLVSFGIGLWYDNDLVLVGEGESSLSFRLLLLLFELLFYGLGFDGSLWLVGL